MTLAHWMQHWLQVLQAVKTLVEPDVGSDKMTKDKSHLKTFALPESIPFLAKTDNDRQVRCHIADLQHQEHDFCQMYAESDDLHSGWAQFYQGEVHQIAVEIASLEQALITKLIRQNRIPPSTPRIP
jgi:hypothetical protein